MLTRDKHPCPQRDSNPQSQQIRGHTPYAMPFIYNNMSNLRSSRERERERERERDGVISVKKVENIGNDRKWQEVYDCKQISFKKQANSPRWQLAQIFKIFDIRDNITDPACLVLCVLYRYQMLFRTVMWYSLHYTHACHTIHTITLTRFLLIKIAC